MKFKTSVSDFFAIIVCNFSLICVRCENGQARDIETTNAKEMNKDSKVKFIEYQTPIINAESVHLYESFDDPRYFKSKWVQSEAIKRSASEFKYNGQWDLVATHHRIKGDYGLRMKNKSCHHAISTKLDKPFSFTGQPLIVQYDVQYRDGQDCGGAYIKLLGSPSGNLSALNDKTPFSLMFGPDKCGSDHKVHFIFVHKNKKNGNIRELHWKDSHTVSTMGDAVTDRKWHNFRLIVRPDNTFEITLDKIVVGKGSLLEEFSPPVNADPVIESDEEKPEDWDDREMIPDPDAVKPQDWDENEPEKIPDHNAKMPEGWLEEEPLEIADPNAEAPADLSEDEFWEPPLVRNPACANVPGCGPWSPPLISNPKYRGKWEPPMIPNSNYQGKWEPKKIPNPDYYEDNNPYQMQPIDGVAFELWTMNEGIVFDNVLITSDLSVASMIAEATYQVKRELNDEETDNWFKSLIKSTNKKPWLWAVYVIVIAVPLILFIGFCCVSPVHPSLNEHHRNLTHAHKSSHPFTCESHPIIHDSETSRFSEESDFPFTRASNQTQDTYGTFLSSHKIHHQSASSSADRYMTILPEIREVRHVEAEELDELEGSQTDNIDFSINNESLRPISRNTGEYHGDREDNFDDNNYKPIDGNSDWSHPDWSHPDVHHVPIDEESSAYFSLSCSGLQDDFDDLNPSSISTGQQNVDQNQEIAQKYEEIEDVINKSDDEDIEENLCKKVTIDEHTVRRRKKRNRQQDNHNKKANTKSKSKKNRHQR